ncbi:MAG: YeeE/YedE family protein [Betaproteobacteria bacterium]|nr:YeeE/YedE family protein [Betaproteobacteria bacterium]
MFPLDDQGMVSGLITGFLFGFVLENAGFGSPCKLTAQFRLSDWSVFKVMFTAIVVAAVGLYVLRRVGLLQGEVYVPSALLAGAAVGGLLIGAGFAAGGYCPGTSVVGFFSGRLDALVFLVGLLVGTFAFAGLYGPAIEALMQAFPLKAGDTLTDATGLSEPLWLLILVLMLVGAYLIGNRMERRMGGALTADDVLGASKGH